MFRWRLSLLRYIVRKITAVRTTSIQVPSTFSFSTCFSLHVSLLWYYDAIPPTGTVPKAFNPIKCMSLKSLLEDLQDLYV